MSDKFDLTMGVLAKYGTLSVKVAEPEVEDAPPAVDAGGEPAESPAQTLEDLAAEFDAENTPDAKEEPETKEGTPSTSALPPSIQDYINTRYQGDAAKFVDGLYSSSSRMAELDAELKAVKAQLSARESVDPEAEFKTALDDSEDVKLIDEQLAHIKWELENTAVQSNNIIQQMGAVEKDIARLEGKIELALDVDKPALVAQKQNLETKKENLTRAFYDNEEKARKAKIEQRQFQRSRSRAEQEVRSQMARKTREMEREAELTQTVLSDYNSAFAAAAAEYGLEPGSPRYNQLHTNVRLRLYEYTSARPANSPGLDLAEAAKIVLKEQVDVFGLTASKAFSKASARKVAARAPLAPRGTSVATPSRPSVSNDPQQWSAQYAKDRARQLLQKLNGR